MSEASLGPDPPEGELAYRQGVAIDVAQACGVPAALIDPSADGTAQRAGWGRWIDGQVEPVARIVAAELTEKLEAPIRLDVGRLARADHLLSRARAAAQLVAAGAGIGDALEAAGLTDG